MKRRLLLSLLLWPSLVFADYRTYISHYLSPTHYYYLDETSGTTATDHAGGGFTADNGTYTGGFTLGSLPIVGNNSAFPSVTVNGSTGYVVTSGSTDARPNGTNNAGWSAVAWAYPTSSVASRQFVVGSVGAATNNWSIQLTNTASVLQMFGVVNNSGTSCSGGSYTLATFVGSWTTNTWINFAMTTVGAGTDTLKNFDFYVNGVDLDSESSFSGNICNITEPTGMGARTLTTPDRFLTGRVDEVAFFNFALTQQQITAIYQLGIQSPHFMRQENVKWNQTKPYQMGFFFPTAYVKKPRDAQ